MPCYDPRSDEAADHNYQAAAILCDMVKLFKRDQVGDTPSGTEMLALHERMLTWWLEHEKRDTLRDGQSDDRRVPNADAAGSNPAPEAK